MDDEIKILINDINRLLNKNYNLISFNEMNNDELLQLLCESLNIIQIETKLNFDQDKNEMMQKLPEILKYIGYKNITETQMEDLLKGDKKVIHPILIWLFKNMEKVQLRAYLAGYLIRINVPTQYLEYPEIRNIYKNYLQVMDTFKKTHLEYQKTKGDFNSVKGTEEKIDSLTKNIVFLKSRVTESKEKLSKISDFNENLDGIETLWQQYQKEEQMMTQMKDQQTLIDKLDSEYVELQLKLHNMQSTSLNVTNPLNQIRDELGQNTDNLNKLRNQNESSKKKIERLRQVVAMVNVTEDDMNTWRERIDDLQFELKDLEDKKRQQIDPLSNRLAPYRKELSALTDNRTKMTNIFNKTKTAYQIAERSMEEKRTAVDKIIGHEVKRGSELKDYIRKLREKNQLVDYYKEILSGFKSEYEIKQRTMEILSQKHSDLKDVFEKGKLGIKTSVLTNKNSPNSLSDAIHLCKQTKLNVDNTKAQLTAYMQEVLPLREAVKAGNQRLLQVQKKFEADVGGLKQQQVRAEREIESLKIELQRKEDQWKSLKRDIASKEEILQQMFEETAGDTNITRSQKIHLESQLKDLQEEIEKLTEKKSMLEKTQTERKDIQKSWNTAKTLLEIKMKNRIANNKNVQKIGNTEILTL